MFSGLQLPASGPMCYKPYMRKWMHEKLKRRKKSAEETAAQPAPLQPAYFEADPAAAPQPEIELQEPDIRQAEPETPAAPASETSTPSASGTQSPTGQMRRPRRRR